MDVNTSGLKNLRTAVKLRVRHELACPFTEVQTLDTAEAWQLVEPNRVVRQDLHVLYAVLEHKVSNGTEVFIRVGDKGHQRDPRQNLDHRIPCQGLDLREGLKTSSKLEKARSLLRSKVAFYDKDRFFAPDITAATELLASRCLNELAPAKLLPSL